MKKTLAILGITLLLCGTISSQEPRETKEKKVRLCAQTKPRLLIEANWTAEDRSIVARHFRRLQQFHYVGAALPLFRRPQEMSC